MNHTIASTDQLVAEQHEHDEVYAKTPDQDRPLTLHSYEEETFAYPWQANFSLYAEESARFFRTVAPAVDRAAREGSPVLDYACGSGRLACYLALRGCRSVYGFDLSSAGVRVGTHLARISHVEDRVHLQQMNAQSLDYPDNRFPLVIGKGVLHHVLKYPGVADEIRRVMTPGGVAYFLENLGNGPAWRFIRERSIAAGGDLGDINLTTALVEESFARFASCEVEGFHLAFMAKRFFYRNEPHESHLLSRPLPAGLVQAILTTLYLADEVCLNHNWIGRRYGGMCIITVRK
jgi:SAM-dependent methyltransferase